ncbi:hypothetical protein [Dongia sedimenti]|uniref:Energy transducer TonB n=1 Tax=Dongia sedimenti TaxID=3064282 RepID=A0ABU0YFL6_9PROT|nr:hypothetical protein [Rhodospirillaceae bacterium R-7]
MQLVWAERSYPITGGILASVVFHVLLALLIVLGVPSFFKPEVLETPPTIELATLSDITAAPKVDKQGKPDDKPKTPPAPDTKKQTKPEPPKPAPPTPASAPPPAQQEQAAVIPDKPLEKEPDQKKPEPKPEEKKVEEKKKPDKPKPDKKLQQDMNELLNSLATDTPAPETEEKPKKTAAPAPAEPTVGQQTANISDVPLTMAESDGIARQIQPNWNIDTGSLPGDPHQYMAWLRVTFGPDGTVQGIEYLEPQRVASDQRYRTVAESCKWAFQKTQRITFPPGKEQPTIKFGCDPALMVGY